MRRWAVALGALIVLFVGAGAVFLPLIEKHVAEEMRLRIEQRGTAKVGTIEVGVLQRRIVLGNVTVTRQGAAEPMLKVARIEARGLGWPLDELLAGRTPFTGWKWGDPVSADRIELTDIYMVDPGSQLEWRIDKIVVEDVDLARHEPATTLFPGSLAQEARVLGALRIGRIREQGLTFGSTADGGLRLASAGIVLENYDRGRIGSLKFSDTDMRKSGAARPDLSIGEISAIGLDLRQPLDRLKGAIWRPGMPIGRVWAEQVSLAGFGGESLTGFGLSLDRIVAETKRESDRFARGTTRIEGLLLKPTGSGREGMQVRIALLSLGVSEVKATVQCSGFEDRIKGELAIDKCVVSSDGLAEISFAGKIVNADEPFWQAVDGGGAAALIGSKAALGSVEIVLRDDSLLERLIRIYADSTSQEFVPGRALLVQEIRRFVPTDVLVTEDLTKLADTIARFVERGGTLRIAANPDPPFEFDRFGALLGRAPDLVDALGLKATLSRR